MPRTFVSRFRARSYELDALGHLNHAVFLNYFEQARIDALEASGLPQSEFGREGWVVYVVRIEVEYRREVRLGDELVVRTRVEEIRNASMTIRQAAYRDGDTEAPAVEARVVAVWIGRDGRPARIPDAVRSGLGWPSEPASRQRRRPALDSLPASSEDPGSTGSITAPRRPRRGRSR